MQALFKNFFLPELAGFMSNFSPVKKHPVEIAVEGKLHVASCRQACELKLLGSALECVT